MITIIAIDRNSSDTMSRTFNTENLESFSNSVLEWENELPYRKYELITDELIENNELEDVLDILDVTF